jgi:hypothetical protein
MVPKLRPLFVRILASLGLAALLATPLSAQLDPRLQTGTTDFLDLYQPTGVKSKPEIVTLFDFSGSMTRIMFHPLYPNNRLHEEPSTSYGCDGSATYSNIKIRLIRSGSKSPYTWTPSISLVKGTQGSTPTPALTGSQLIGPDGTVITQAWVDTNVKSNASFAGSGATPPSSDVRNWVRAASHVRMTDGTRSVDLPIPWCVMDANSGWNSTGQVNSVKVQDPDTHANYYEVDSLHLLAPDKLLYVYQSSYANDTVEVGNRTDGNTYLYRNYYLYWIFNAKDTSGNYIVPTAPSTQQSPFLNGLATRTRYQAVKEAAIKTWFQYQDKVLWAYRALDGTEDDVKNINASVTAPAPPYAAPTGAISGDSKTWYVLNGDSASQGGVLRIAALWPGGGTPLTHSFANALAEMQNVNPFATYEHNTNKPVQCMLHFVILFTDGSPNENPNPTEADQPYASNATDGNTWVKAHLSSIDTGGSAWNVPTLAAVAAHGGNKKIGWAKDPTTSTTTGSNTVSSYAPFWIKYRGVSPDDVDFTAAPNTPHPIQVMTVGISLGESFQHENKNTFPYISSGKLAITADKTAPKYRLLAAATEGDPRVTSWDLTNTSAYAYDPINQTKKIGTAYYFDGVDPSSLVANLGYAFADISAQSGSQSSSRPIVPFVGLGLASQVYLGSFDPPDTGGPIWPGDLLMFPTKQVNGQTVILNYAGQPASLLTKDNAAWAASKIFNTKKWSDRTVYTRLPATTASPTPPLVRFKVMADSSDPLFAAVATSQTALSDKNDTIRFVLGADITNAALPNRTTIMGDVIDSAPASLEYTLTSSIISKLPTSLRTAALIPGARFRVIFVGTNQGMLHAFGEVSYTDSTTNPGSPFTTGVVDELWAFIPTDFLANIDYLRGPTNKHRFMVDGSPYIYLLDIPTGSNIAGNGTADAGETARVVFGLRKGGRSYYSLNIEDPFNPQMAWALRADEAATMPSGRAENGSITADATALAATGFSTSQINVGRVSYGASPQTLRDVVFLGGGLSVPEIEANFLDASGKPTPLGRSVLAVDVKNGNILQVWDFHSTTLSQPSMGPVTAGVVPFEYFLNSGLVQRAYFTDFNGSLWALGSGKTTTASDGKNYRRDTSSLDAWTVDGTPGSQLSVRKVYQGTKNDYLTSLPAVFLTGMVPQSAGTIPVGIALATGDRNNPLDTYSSSLQTPSGHEAIVVFDDQEQTTGNTPIKYSDLYSVPENTAATATTPDAINPGVPTKFYLAIGDRGYSVPFPAPANGFIPKALNDPLVLGGALFFTYFTPTTADPCTGGTGISTSSRVCDVLYPRIESLSSTTLVSNTYGGACRGGGVFAWQGIATNFSARSTVSVNQAGIVSTGGSTTPSGSNQVQIETIFGQAKDRLPRPRTWRTVR